MITVIVGNQNTNLCCNHVNKNIIGNNYNLSIAKPTCKNCCKLTMVIVNLNDL